MGIYELVWLIGGAAVYVTCTLWVKTRPEKGRCTKCGSVDYLHGEENLCHNCIEVKDNWSKR